MTIFNLWAKAAPFQSVVTHGIVSGVVAQQVLSLFLPAGTRDQLCRGLNVTDAQLEQFVGYFTSLHDIGKINYYFQAMQEDRKPEMEAAGLAEMDLPDLHFRHERESFLALKKIWDPIDHRNGVKLAEILGAHHQGKRTSLTQPQGSPPWEALQQAFEGEMRQRFWHSAFTFPKLEKSSESAVSAILLGIVILSDWIASSDCFDTAEAQADLREYARLQAAQFLQWSGLHATDMDFGTGFYEVWPNIPAGGARELQKNMETLFQHDPSARFQLILAEAPMGEGKTEAGVYAALQMARQWKKRGFYIALPTSATANQMVERMRKLLKQHGMEAQVKLLHAMAWMVDEKTSTPQSFVTEDEQFARNWLMPLRRGFLSPYAVGTVDQAMMAAMFIRYGVLRLLGLSAKTLVIDEVHAYDTYMQNILEGLLSWCRALEIPVVLLSATLPPEKKQRLLRIYTQDAVPHAYPAISAVTDTGKLQIVPVTHVAMHQKYAVELLPILHQPEAIAAAAAEKVAHGGCLCVLLNTVSQAQDTFSALRKSGFSGTLLLFHARFLAARREEIEKKCVSLFGKDRTHRPSQAILVATQVVEQSLDVDFDFLLTAVAPMDLLLQRMGREYRHSGKPRPGQRNHPTVTILTPSQGDFQQDSAVYPACLLRQTMHLLEQKQEILVPEEVAQLVADAYDSSKVPQQELDAWMENLVEAELRGAAAEQYKLGRPEKRFRPLVSQVEFDDLEQQSYLSAQTRLSPPTVRIALLSQALYDALLEKRVANMVPVTDLELARAILKRSVSVSKKMFDRLSQKYKLWDITGDKLIAGVKLIPLDNPCLEDHPALGVIWKGE